MASVPSSAAEQVRQQANKAGHRLRDFWQRVTEGLELEQLWGQFKAEAQASYGLYSKDVDWAAIEKEEKKWKRVLLSAWALFQAMLMKLSPARRVLLLIAVFLILVEPEINFSQAFRLQTGGIGGALLFILLALELGDRVTMKRDLEIAREIQQWLVPANPPAIAGVDIAFATRPQNTVAGDYYDAFLRPASAGDSASRRLMIVVADVAGKSVPAALLMATFQASLKAFAASPGTIENIVAGLDRYARAHSLEGRRFTTAFLGELSLDTRELTYVNAGHNDPILRRASGQIERLSSGGPPFGLPSFGDAEIHYQVGRAPMNPGDLLFIFTDGVIEAVNDLEQEYSEARLLSRISPAAPEPAGETLKRVMRDVDAFVGATRQHDDITCLVVRIIG